MNKNIFYKKFQEKTDFELKQILIENHKYTEQAINAANVILEERNGQKSNLESIRKKIEQPKQKTEVPQQKITKKVKKKKDLAQDPNAPKLYSKRVITLFSAIFSAIFGAVLLMSNMKQTNNRKGRNQVIIFGIVYTVASISIINMVNINTNLALVFNLAGAGILNEYFWNKFIGKEFKYHNKSWIKPAIISVIITIPFMLALFYSE